MSKTIWPRHMPVFTYEAMFGALFGAGVLGRGVVSEENHSLRVLTPRQELTGAERRALRAW
jgi:hypothetical protein